MNACFSQWLHMNACFSQWLPWLPPLTFEFSLVHTFTPYNILEMDHKMNSSV